METRRLGSLEVPAIGIGCNNFGARLDQESTTAVVEAALETGCRFFDTADVYGGTESERMLGVALGTRREEVLVASKFGAPLGGEPGGAAPDYVHRACRASLERLGTDHLDLYQLHMPDPQVPITETMGALDELVAEGLVRAIGCSNMNGPQLASANAAARGARFVSVQNQYSLLWREPEVALFDELDAEGAGLLPYYPLANGLLTGKYRRGEPPPAGMRLAILPAERSAHWLSDATLTTVEEIRVIAAAYDRTMVELAFSWLLSRPQVSCVIAGASSPEQVRTNAAAALPLDAELVEALDAATAHLVMVG
jgi:aryl-alcohol dehydrogenase-like predicted oxidoreductase